MGLTNALDATLVAICSQRVARDQVAELGDESGAATNAVAGLSIDYSVPAFGTEIFIWKATTARSAFDLLRHYDAVGLEYKGFLDNSVACHVYL